MNKIIGITIGDINGIGIEILLNSWKQNKIKHFILFTNIKVFQNYLNKRKLKFKLNKINNNLNKINFSKNIINIFSYEVTSYEDNTYKSLKYAYEYCINKNSIGIITLPLRKDKIKNKIDKKFIGHTEFFQQIDKKKHVNMILHHKKIIVSPLTTHIEIKKISNYISNKVYIYNQIFNLNNTLKIDFNIAKPRIVISGLNPHSGENGQFGKEEINFITPVINKLKRKGINIYGPYSADSMLIKSNLNKYDCFVFIYHDQALIPFKYISQFTGVNYTGNLSVIRTSPDHGTAYDLIGSNNVSNQSLINCYKLIKKIYKNKMINGKI